VKLKEKPGEENNSRVPEFYKQLIHAMDADALMGFVITAPDGRHRTACRIDAQARDAKAVLFRLVEYQAVGPQPATETALLLVGVHDGEVELALQVRPYAKRPPTWVALKEEAVQFIVETSWPQVH
jgi:hypothetical protein